MNLSEHFTLEEFLVSQEGTRHGIINTPSASALVNLGRLAESLELCRIILGHPIHINSGYRNPTLNRLVGGAHDSAHMYGMAADIICPKFGNALEVCRAIAGHGIDFDQIIFEFGAWCHFAIGDAGASPRKELLTIRNKKEGYVKGLLA